MNATAPAEKAMYVHNTAGWVQIPFPFPSYHMQQPLTRQKFRVTLELSFGRKTWSLTSSQWLKKSIEAVNIRRHCKEGQVSSFITRHVPEAVVSDCQCIEAFSQHERGIEQIGCHYFATAAVKRVLICCSRKAAILRTVTYHILAQSPI